MVDRTTLPYFEVGDSIEAGQRFEVKGYRFDLLPDELILSYSPVSAVETQAGYRILSLVEKTDELLVFESANSHTFNTSQFYSYIATPFDIPRSIVEYGTIN